MQSNQTSVRQKPSPDSHPGDDGTSGAVRSEDLFIRNYDPFRGYALRVTVNGADGAPVLDETYYLQPGGIKSVADRLSPGEYEVAVRLDSYRRKTADCRVSPSPEQTIHVELGNGTVSLTEGLYGSCATDG